MTVIAWDGKTLAADKRATNGSTTYALTKVFRVGERLVGFAGQADRMGEFRAWFEAGGDPHTFPTNTGEDAAYFMAVRRDGVIERYESTGWPIIVEAPHFACGDGRDYALAAMHLGCDAREAVGVACHFDAGCGNGIDTLSFGDDS